MKPNSKWNPSSCIATPRISTRSEHFEMKDKVAKKVKLVDAI